MLASQNDILSNGNLFRLSAVHVIALWVNVFALHIYTIRLLPSYIRFDRFALLASRV